MRGKCFCCFKQLSLGAILPTAVPVCSGHRPKVLHGQAAFSCPPGLEAARPRPRRGRGWLLSPGHADGRLFLTWSSPCVSVLSSSPCEDTSQMGSGPTLLTSVYLNRLLKEEVEGPGGHSEVLGLWLQHGIWGGAQLTPQQRPWVTGRTAHFCPCSGLGALEAIFPGKPPPTPAGTGREVPSHSSHRWDLMSTHCPFLSVSGEAEGCAP